MGKEVMSVSSSGNMTPFASFSGQHEALLQAVLRRGDGRPAYVEVCATKHGKGRLNDFWPIWLRALIHETEYRREHYVVVTDGNHVHVSAPTIDDTDTLWRVVVGQTRRIYPIQNTLVFEQKAYRRLTWLVVPEDYTRLQRQLAGIQKKLEKPLPGMMLECEFVTGKLRGTYGARLIASWNNQTPEWPEEELRQYIELAVLHPMI